VRNASASLLLAAALAHAQYAVTTVAGGGIPSGIPAQNALLSVAITRDSSGNVYVCGDALNVIQRIRPDGIIETFAGTGLRGYLGDGGPALLAQLNYPAWCVMDKSGNLIFSDNYNARIRRIDPSGIITTIVGTGIGGSLGNGGPGVTAQIDYYLGGIAVDGSGSVYFSDYGSTIRKLTPAGTVECFAGCSQSLNSSNGDGGPALAAFLNRQAISPLTPLETYTS